MTKSKGPGPKCKTDNYTVLTKVEKLDGRFPGLATEARMLFDQGVSAAKTAEILRSHFPAEDLSTSNVSHFRGTRWKPQKKEAAEKFTALQAFFEENGGNYGLDLAAFAKVRELLDESKDIKDANAIRLSLLKCREQDLKELAFELKIRQQTASAEAAQEEDDPVAEETKRKRVMNKIRGIFGLDPLPEDTSDEEPAEANQEPETANIQVPSSVEGEAHELSDGLGTAGGSTHLEEESA